MGFFDFLKPKKQEVRVFSLEEIGEEIDTLIKDNTQKVSVEIEELKKKILEEKELALENIKKLEQAKLKNEDIPEKIKGAMQGNRETYIQRYNKFLKEFNLPKEIEEILEFYDVFDKSLDSFGRNTAKNSMVIGVFFSTETKNLSHNLIIFDKHVKNIKKQIESAKLDTSEELKEAFK